MRKFLIVASLFACFISVNLGWADVVYSGPLQITKGSTTPYQGNWQSTSVNVPAVDIQTTDPVTIDDCHIKGPGLLIKTVPGAQLTLKNCSIYGVNPSQRNRSRPRVLDGVFSDLVVENNLFDHTAGMSIWNMAAGNTASHPTKSAATIQIKYNVVHNIDGRLENGGSCGSFLPAVGGQPPEADDHCHVNFVGIVGFLSDPNIEIAWNEIINTPGQSASEDLILIMSSSGTPQQPILIHDNFIKGVYGGAPATSIHYGGSGINTGDYLTRLNSPHYISAFVHTYNNQIVGPLAWGICLVAGHDITVDNNRIIRSGFLPDGTPMGHSASGLMMVDLYKLEPKSATPINNNNQVTNNVIAYMSQDQNKLNQRLDYEFYGPPGKPNLQCVGSRANVNQCCVVEKQTIRAGATVTCSPNLDYKLNSDSPTISSTDEENEMTLWNQKVAQNAIVLGPSKASVH